MVGDDVFLVGIDIAVVEVRDAASSSRPLPEFSSILARVGRPALIRSSLAALNVPEGPICQSHHNAIGRQDGHLTRKGPPLAAARRRDDLSGRRCKFAVRGDLRPLACDKSVRPSDRFAVVQGQRFDRALKHLHAALPVGIDLDAELGAKVGDSGGGSADDEFLISDF